MEIHLSAVGGPNRYGLLRSVSAVFSLGHKLPHRVSSDAAVEAGARPRRQGQISRRWGLWVETGPFGQPLPPEFGQERC